MSSPPTDWDFAYHPVQTTAGDDDGDACDVIVATRDAHHAPDIARALSVLEEISLEVVLERAPLFWTRVRSPTRAPRAAVRVALEAAGIAVRYVASARRGSVTLGEPLDFRDAPRTGSSAWKTRAARPVAPPTSDGTWFLREETGIAVNRRRCGTGAGTRLAVIDDDAAEAEHLSLDAEVLVGIDRPPRASSHGALMVGWAVGCPSHEAGPMTPFAGVAPDASARLYCIPKPGVDVVSFPLALVRAADDGADVAVTAVYAEGSSSPMLDDALEFAMRLGRRGRGMLVVMPTGREASSAPGSVHASWSLALGDPASDPRVFCVGPSARDGGWFIWKDRKGKLRPFANRGPAVRWLAPGDDVAYPFAARERLYHSESSGASAIAAGALLLVVAANPSLRAGEVDELVTRTATRVPPRIEAHLAPIADPADWRPVAVDRDGHNAKHGYGRIHAEDSCAGARDPIAFTLVAMGDRAAARGFLDARRRSPSVRDAYSRALARWAARAVLSDATLAHSLRVVVRHARLVARRTSRQEAHEAGSVARHVALFLRALRSSKRAPRRSRAVERELASLAASVLAFCTSGSGAHVDRHVFDLASAIWTLDDANAPRSRLREDLLRIERVQA